MRARAAEMSAAGSSLGQIADELGISRSYARDIVAREREVMSDGSSDLIHAARLGADVDAWAEYGRHHPPAGMDPVLGELFFRALSEGSPISVALESVGRPAGEWGDWLTDPARASLVAIVRLCSAAAIRRLQADLTSTSQHRGKGAGWLLERLRPDLYGLDQIRARTCDAGGGLRSLDDATLARVVAAALVRDDEAQQILTARGTTERVITDDPALRGG